MVHLVVCSCTTAGRLALRFTYRRTPLIWTLVIRIGFVSSCKSVQNSTKLTCLEITGHRIKYNTVLGILELQIRYGRKF